LDKEVKPMDDLLRSIPYEYWDARIRFLTDRLNKLPVVKLGKHSGAVIYRLYEPDHKHCREISRSSSKWEKAAEIHSQRESVNELLIKAKELSKRNTGCLHMSDYSIRNTDNLYGNDFYDSLRDSSCTAPKTSTYCYKGRSFRSRVEVLIAETLDELGLEFKYDVMIRANGKNHSVDFVIIFREFNRCIFIEFFGRSRDPEYNRDNSIKIEHLTNSGIYLGRDLFILSGDDRYMPGPDVIKQTLIAIIAGIARHHIGMRTG